MTPCLLAKVKFLLFYLLWRIWQDDSRDSGGFDGLHLVDITWSVQVVRYPNFFLGNGSR